MAVQVAVVILDRQAMIPTNQQRIAVLHTRLFHSQPIVEGQTLLCPRISLPEPNPKDRQAQARMPVVNNVSLETSHPRRNAKIKRSPSQHVTYSNLLPQTLRADLLALKVLKKMYPKA